MLMNSLMNYAIRRRMQNDFCMLEWNFRENSSNRDFWDRCLVVEYSCHHVAFENNLIKIKKSLTDTSVHLYAVSTTNLLSSIEESSNWTVLSKTDYNCFADHTTLSRRAAELFTACINRAALTTYRSNTQHYFWLTICDVYRKSLIWE